ncbi:MAG: sulfatase [Cyclobacteriaceae bacterium]
MVILFCGCNSDKADQKLPNILFVISDDQSYPYASAYGDYGVNTPAFDKVANNGLLFNNAIVASPGCSPSRAAILTGLYPWQIEQAGTHGSSFPKKYTVFPDLLEQQADYHVGYTGKPWGPGKWQVSGRTRNPVGIPYDTLTLSPNAKGISNKDYASNFEYFLSTKADDKPFYFWFGAHEPHRVFEKGIGLKSGKTLKDAVVPGFLPDTPEIRSDILDFYYEIEWFDSHLERMIKHLESIGELENTIIIVTSDNGMAFPRAKANCFEYGVHVPLAIRWDAQISGGRKINTPVSLIDIYPTLIDITGVNYSREKALSGSSLSKLFDAEKSGELERNGVFSSRERHSSSRYNNWTYPQRAYRTSDYLYIRNFRPNRWPAGAPQKFDNDSTLGPEHGGYHDIDNSPSLQFLIEGRDHEDFGKFYHLAVDKRPEEEFYNIKEDPFCLNNLALLEEHSAVKNEFKAQLESYLKETGDPRIIDGGEIWESYPRLSGRIRKFPKPEGFKD